MSCLHAPVYRTAWLGMAQLFRGGKLSPGLLLPLCKTIIISSNWTDLGLNL